MARSSHHIDAWLRGEVYAHPAKHPIVGFADLACRSTADAQTSIQHELPITQRERDFDEVSAA